MVGPDPLVLLRALVEAHAVPHPNTVSREPIMYLRYMGGANLQHHALGEPPAADDALLEEMHSEGWLDIDYRENSWNITPTPRGREVIKEHDRVLNLEPTADLRPLLDAISAQASADSKLSWTAVRPVLAALRGYWEAGGFSPDGIQLPAIFDEIPEEHDGMVGATFRALLAGDYLRGTTNLEVKSIPAEVSLTERAHTVLDGWPGAAPEDLVENLLSVLTEAVDEETDPVRKKRLQRVMETVKDLGVPTAGQLLARVLLGS